MVPVRCWCDAKAHQQYNITIFCGTCAVLVWYNYQCGAGVIPKPIRIKYFVVPVRCRCGVKTSAVLVSFQSPAEYKNILWYRCGAGVASVMVRCHHHSKAQQYYNIVVFCGTGVVLVRRQ